ncbi:MAG: hypothetical protein LBH43_20035 [Treponema sp.]|jgi:uncharacterized protein YcfL|nr:hypothetical protein [Treponema sp.]
MMRKYALLTIIPFLALASCASRRIPPQEPVQEPVMESLELVFDEEAETAEAVFDPASISLEDFEIAKSEIQHLVLDLNRIIQAKNYNSWLSYLSEDYHKKINSKIFLDALVDKYPAFRGKLRNGADYFIYVVVPSRSHDHVDDIAFISEYQVRAYTVNSKGQTAILYNLEHLNDKWKIADLP